MENNIDYRVNSFFLSLIFFFSGHTSRILSLIMSPKGNPIVSLSADETIRFWNCFPIDIERKKKIEMTRTYSYPTQLNFNCR